MIGKLPITKNPTTITHALEDLLPKIAALCHIKVFIEIARPHSKDYCASYQIQRQARHSPICSPSIAQLASDDLIHEANKRIIDAYFDKVKVFIPEVVGVGTGGGGGGAGARLCAQ